MDFGFELSTQVKGGANISGGCKFSALFIPSAARYFDIRNILKMGGALRRRKNVHAFMTFLQSFSLFLEVLLLNKSDIVVFYQIKPAAGEFF